MRYNKFIRLNYNATGCSKKQPVTKDKNVLLLIAIVSIEGLGKAHKERGKGLRATGEEVQILPATPHFSNLHTDIVLKDAEDKSYFLDEAGSNPAPAIQRDKTLVVYRSSNSSKQCRRQEILLTFMCGWFESNSVNTDSSAGRAISQRLLPFITCFTS